ncbi:hypothetical protein SAMN05443582_102140 [Phyllobacterium sp. OV277]|nr:hypothetical protein SAMN05443582_102140 [Phyllobacterium sp. OV277]
MGTPGSRFFALQFEFLADRRNVLDAPISFRVLAHSFKTFVHTLMSVTMTRDYVSTFDF